MNFSNNNLNKVKLTYMRIANIYILFNILYMIVYMGLIKPYRSHTAFDRTDSKNGGIHINFNQS